MPPLNELIGMIVAIALALGLLSLLVYARAVSADWPRRRIVRLLLSLWLLVLGVIVLLVGLRGLLGAPLISGSVGGARENAESLTIQHLGPVQISILVVAVALVAGALIWLRHLLRSLPQTDFIQPSTPRDSGGSC